MGLIYFCFGITSISPLMAQSLGVGGGADSFHSLAVSADGKVYAWGGNWAGQLGNGTYITQAIPQDISGYGALAGKTIVQVANGFSHSLALASDGTVYAWGRGWLGTGVDYPNDLPDIPFPVQVPNLTGVKAIATGSSISIALKTDGTVYAWGGGYGNSPVQVNGLTNITAIAGNVRSFLALKSDGTVYFKGDGAHSLLEQVNGLTNVKAIAAGADNYVFLKSDSTVYGWGYSIGSTVPVKIPNLINITAIATGMLHGLALKDDGTVYAWGLGAQGQLGTGVLYQDIIKEPVKVSGLTGVIAIAGGSDHSLALKADGTVYAWGDGFFGQLVELQQFTGGIF